MSIDCDSRGHLQLASELLAWKLELASGCKFHQPQARAPESHSGSHQRLGASQPSAWRAVIRQPRQQHVGLSSFPHSGACHFWPAALQHHHPSATLAAVSCRLTWQSRKKVPVRATDLGKRPFFDFISSRHQSARFDVLYPNQDSSIHCPETATYTHRELSELCSHSHPPRRSPVCP